jgi:phosphate/sulfate permease
VPLELAVALAPDVSHTTVEMSAVLGVHEIRNRPPFASSSPENVNDSARPEDGEHVGKVAVSQDIMRTESENWIMTPDAGLPVSFLSDSVAARHKNATAHSASSNSLAIRLIP